MRSSEVATQAGVNVQTLRYYERRGLVEEPRRSASGYRVYPAEIVEIVRFVKRAQELGFTLDDVGELLHLGDGGPRAVIRRGLWPSPGWSSWIAGSAIYSGCGILSPSWLPPVIFRVPIGDARCCACCTIDRGESR